MEVQEIEVFVKPDGAVRLEVRGVKGAKCLALTEKLEQILGGSIVERIKTPEFHEEQLNALDQQTNIGQE
jgi:hypothetical protein